MNKISTKLWMLMLLLIGLMLALLWIFQVVSLESIYTNARTQNMIAEGNSVADMVAAGATAAQLDDKAEELNSKYNARIDLYAPDGSIYYMNGSSRGMMMGMDRGSILPEVVASGKVSKQIINNRIGNRILLVGIPISEGANIKEILVISTPLSSVKETAGILKQQLVLVSVILIFASLILSYFFSRSFTKPILKINDAAIQMASGDLSVKIDVNSKDELGILANNINDLAVQLQKIEQLRKDLIANVSHELRTPLSLIRGYAETIRDVTGNDDQKRNSELAIIIEEADRLKLMIDDILNLSQIQSQYTEANKACFDLQATTEAVARRFANIKDKNKIKLNINIQNNQALVYANEMRIEQVLFNLIGNAFNHTPVGGSIEISVFENADKVRVEIKDNGDGISKEDLQFIWDRFYKGRSNRTIYGTGLGLSIVKNILEVHQANFGVESELGKGAKFWFELEKGSLCSAEK